MTRPTDDEIRATLATLDRALNTPSMLGDSETAIMVRAVKEGMQWALTGEGNMRDLIEVITMSLRIVKEREIVGESSLIR